MAQLKLRPGAPAAFPDPDVIPLPASDPDVISLAGQEDPDVIPLGNAGVGQPARPATTPLTSPAQPAHNEAAGVSQPQGQGPIPPLAYPHTPTKVGAGISRGPASTAQQPAFSPNQTIEILPRLESVSPIPAPPMPAAPIPTGLQGRPSRTPQGEFPRFGPGQDLAIPGPLPGFQGVIPGIEKMGRGFSRMSYGTPAAGLGGSPRQTTSQAPNQIDPDAWRPPDLPARVGAAADLVEGFEEASAPYVLPALAAGAVAGGIPAATMIGANMLFGAAGEELTRRGLESAGVDPRYAKAAGKVVGWGPVEKTPGYSHAIGGAAEALIPDSPTKQFATGLGKSVEEFNTLVDDLAKMDPASPEYSQSLSQLKAGEAQLGVAANTLAQANLLGAIKSAQVMGKMRKVLAAETAAAGAPEPLPSPDVISLPAADSVSAGEPKYKSGTTQYNLPDGIGAKVQFIGEQIPDEALAESGRESQPHLTIRYGLGEDPKTSLPKVRQALADQAPITVKLGEASLFPDRGDGEVLKLDLEKSPELESVRAKLAQAGIDHIPDIGDTEGYSPHITVAYLKPGEGQKYVGPNSLTGQELVIDRLWLGDRQGNQYEVPFGKSIEGILGPEQEALRPMLGEAAGSESALLAGQMHIAQPGQPTAGQLWTPEQLSKSLPGYKLDLLPNNERTNPGGATLGLETPSGKWAKLVVTKGRDLPASPESMAKQLGRPAQPGEVVMGQYESRGLREQSVITLAGAAGPETLDHELFHYAFDTFLTPKEQAAILAAHGSEEAAAIAYGQGKGGLDPGLSRLKKLFTEIHNKFYPDSKATIERLRQGQIWERQARYGVDTREPVYRKPDGSLDWSLDSMAKSFLETFDRNLVRFESNDPVFLAATLAAPGTSQSISREALIGPAQEIARAMHAGGYGQGSLQQGWRAFAEVLIDNRLAGVQGRWNDLAGAVEKATQKQLRQGLARHGDAPDGPLIRVLDRIDSDQPMANGNSRAGKVQAMLEAKDYAGAKAYLGALFRHNAYATKRLDLQGTYGKSLAEFAQDPQFKQALQTYKSKIEALFASHHLKNEGMLSADLGPLDTYYPLVPQETGDMPLWQQSARQRGYWIRPHNPSNYFTTGLATKGYDPELSTLRGRLTAAIRGGNVAQFLQVMRGTGLAVKVTDSTAATAVFRGGEELPVAVIPLGSAQSISVKGQQLKVPPQFIAVPKALGPTIRAIVLGEGPGGSSAFHSEGFIEDAVNRITGWSLVGPADAAFHAQAVLSSLVAGTPYLRQSNAFKSVMANLPVTKAFTAMWEAYRKPAKWFTSPEGEKTLMAMAQGGMLNPRIGSVAWDKDFADLFGAEWKPPVWRKEAWRRTPEESAEAKAGGLGAKIASYLDVAGRIGDLGTSAVVFGHPGEGSSRWLGLDLRARVALYELHLQLFPDAPLADRANFVNQAMQYNWGLQSHLEQYIKGYAGTRFTSVFFTAGYSMIRAGVRAMNPVGTRHGLNRLDPIGQQQLARAQRAFSGGITGMVAGWALLNFASSGGKHWPWETDQEGGPVPLNSIALPDDIRQSPVGLALMGDPAKGAPKRGYMPMGFFNAAVKKGLDVTGVRAAYDTGKLLEGKPGQANMGWTDPVGRQLIAQEALRSSMNTFLHPLTSGPVPRAGMAALGMSPWIGPMWDPITGRNQFSMRAESRAAGSLFEATGAGLARAAGQMSPMANFLNEAGMESVLGSPLSGATKRDDGAAWAKTLADIMFPRSRPVGKDIPKMVERTRDLVTKRKGLIQRQRADAARAKK